MASTSRRSRTAMVSSLLVMALMTRASAALNAMTYKGCYAVSQPLVDQGFYQYQTSGYCQPICVNQNDAVLATSDGGDCWCGGQLPPASAKVDDSKCNTPCNGFGSEMCGGTNFYSVYLSGLANDVTNFQGAAAANGNGNGSGNSQSSSSSTTTSAAAPSVVTSVSPGNTIVITVSAAPATAPSSSSTNSNNSTGGTSVAGVAAGVVVGVLAIAALLGGVFFCLRRRRRNQAEANYKRSAQISDFMSGSNGRKAPNTAYSQMSDSRLDPEHGRRNSVGSMADDHDYSRRILRVANPDSH